MLSSIYQVTLIETQWTVPSTTLGLDQHTYNLFKRFCGQWLSQNLQIQEKLV